MRLSPLIAFLAFASFGCGISSPPSAVVKGTVTKEGGGAFKLGDSEALTITLKGEKETFAASVSDGGDFSVQKPSGGGIPPGKYKVSYVYSRTASPYNKKPPFRLAKDLPDEWNITESSAPFTFSVPAK